MLYLGTPLPFGKMKIFTFNYLVHKMYKNAITGKDKLLFKDGKMIKLKSVLQCLPTFIMSCFKLPQCICLKLTKTLKRFWWNISLSDISPQKIPWEGQTLVRINWMGNWDLEILQLSIKLF